MKKYYSLVKNKKKGEAELTIFGDITSYPCNEKEVSSYNLSKQLQQLTDVSTINVHINSYGGEVAEGLAIYNSLKNHKAKVKTYCEGFACSIASVIFMAGDERIMSNASLLMIHNAWTMALGNANELRKQADDLDKITQASVNAYMNHVSISEKELKELLDNETWLDCNEALEKGFATTIRETADSNKASQSVRKTLVKMILAKQETETGDIDITDEEGGDVVKFECQECGYVHEGELPEFFVCPECGADKESFIEVEETEEAVTTEDEEETKTETETPEKEEPVEEETTEEETEETSEEEKDEEGNEEVTQKCVAFFNAIKNM